MSGFDLRALRSAFGAFTTGVTVVTSHDATGAPIGFRVHPLPAVAVGRARMRSVTAKGASN